MNFAKYFDTRLLAAAMIAAAPLSGCGDDGDAALPATYNFTNATGESSVVYGGQTFRHVLIQEMNGFVNGLSETIDGDAASPFGTAGRTAAELNSWFRFDDSAAERTFEFVTFGRQDSFDELASPRGLESKTAGNDSSTDHRDWNGGAFLGWNDTALLGADAGSNPTAFVDALIAAMDAQAVARAAGSQATAPDGSPLPVYTTAEGLDLRQLLEKFLRVSVTFSQGADDYLDDDVDGKGLLSDNLPSDGDPYRTLEHQWDEGFGYFGAPRDYGDYTDEEIAGRGGREDWQGRHDTNGDGQIDLITENVWGAASNAAKRDLGSATGTDFTAEVWEGFLRGRQILAESAEGPLSEAQLADLRAARDQARGTWERVIAATAIHYINDTLDDMSEFGTDAYSFATHAVHWAEMKGFALGLQFNPGSPLLPTFAQVHDLMRDQPVLEDAGDAAIAAYEQALLDARALMGTAYGFAQADLEAW